MNHQPADPGYQRGDRIALEHTTDPHTRLQPGDEGTVTSYDPRLGQLNVRWDSGSTLAMLPGDGDQVRLLTPAPGSPQPGPPHRPRKAMNWHEALHHLRRTGLEHLLRLVPEGLLPAAPAAARAQRLRTSDPRRNDLTTSRKHTGTRPERRESK